MTLDRRQLLAAGVLLAVGGCATSPKVTLVLGRTGETEELEPLKAVRAGADGLTIRVASTGCTRREDFAFYVDRAGPEATIAFARKRLDSCRAAPDVVELSFSYQELGVVRHGRLAVLNPVVAD
jgi:hypothetical protein